MNIGDLLSPMSILNRITNLCTFYITVAIRITYVLMFALHTFHSEALSESDEYLCAAARRCCTH